MHLFGRSRKNDANIFFSIFGNPKYFSKTTYIELINVLQFHRSEKKKIEIYIRNILFAN